MEPDVIFINEDDWRNADRRTHSTGQPPPVYVGKGQYIRRPTLAPSTPVAAPSGGQVWVPGVGYQPAGYQPAVGQMPQPQPMVIYQPGSGVDPRAVLGKLTAADLATLASQILAAIQPLPGAPVATGDVKTDVSNLTEYQSALAMHAKRDEQVRTLGNLISKLLG
jgi:hypothetical protein